MRSATGLSVAIVAPPGSESVVGEISNAFALADIQQVELRVATVCVVVLSSRLSGSPTELASSRPEVRLVPITTDSPDLESLPKALREVQWIQWNNENPPIGEVLAAVTFDPIEYRVAGEYAIQTRSWNEANRSAAHLIADARRVQELRAHVVERRNVAQGTDVDEFLAQSLAASLRKRRWRRIRRAVAALSLVVGIGALASAVDSQRNRVRESQARFVAQADSPTLQRDNPRWTALLLASLLVDETDTTSDSGQLVREQLRRLVHKPWDLGRIEYLAGSIDSVLPSQAMGRIFAVSFEPTTGKRFLLETDLDSFELMRQIELPGRFGRVQPIPHTSDIAVVGFDGLVLVDGLTGSVRTATTEEVIISIDVEAGVGWFLTPTEVIRVDTESGVITDRRSVDGQLVGRPSASGFVTHESPDLYRTYDRTGELQFEFNLSAAAARGATVDSDGSVLAIGPNHQLWRVDTEGVALPTGIPAPASTYRVQDLSQGRVLVGSSSDGVVITHVDSAIRLGTVCDGVVDVFELEVDDRADLIACTGWRTHQLWELPAGPTEFVDSTFAPSPAAIEVRGGLVRWVGDERWVDTGLESINVTAKNPGGSQVLVASGEGPDAVVLDVLDDALAVAYRWRAPDQSVVTEASWGGELVVATRAGLRWTIPSCESCSTSHGLVEAFLSRDGACWESPQLVLVSSEARAGLNLDVCEFGR